MAGLSCLHPGCRASQVWRLLPLLVTLCCAARTAAAADSSETQPSEQSGPIQAFADFCHDWVEGDGTHSYVLRGHCRLVQGDVVLRAEKMVLWHRPQAAGSTLDAYLEDNVRLDRPGSTRSQPTLFVELRTAAALQPQFRHHSRQEVPPDDPLVRRATSRRTSLHRSALQPTQMVVATSAEPDGDVQSVQIPSPEGSLRRIRIAPRSVVPFNVYSERSTATTPPEQITVLTGGINLLIDGVARFGTIDLSADRMVIWTRAVDAEQFRQGVETIQARDTPFQVYLEGNIEIRQGQNLLRARQAFYDAREDRALLIDGELRAHIDALEGYLRVRAEKLRQLSQQSFHAQRAWVSTSPFGKPGYRLQASDIFLEHRYVEPWIGPGSTSIDPATGAPIVEDVPWVTSLNNAFLLGDLPLLFAPYLSSPAEDPHIPLRRVTLEEDRVFGGQIETVWNAFQLFGLDAPQGIRWDLLADYRSERGPGIGTAADYEGSSWWGVPGNYRGEGLLYYLHDDGEDNLGFDRRNLAPNSSHRGRILFRHRHELPANTTVQGEIGFLSDRNFLEQYYENEFDEDKDNESLVYLKQHIDNVVWSALVRPQLNDFSTTTEWFPRGDLYVLSAPLFGGLLTWSTHTSVGYAQLRPADAPPNTAADPFAPLPFVADVGGAVVMSRQEVDLPLQLGPFHLVPYLLGERAYWGEDLTGADINRTVGSAGIRGSLMAWRAFPFVGSRIFNLNGLAHKMVLDADVSWTDSNRSLWSDPGRTTDLIPQYNEFDDNAQERFLERLLGTSYGGAFPAVYDPRFYAIRTGAGRMVTVPYHELIDDQKVLRVAWRHRLQTKAGPPERLRIKDWMRLDLEASYFPNPDDDNFGESFGLLGARYHWFVGDRTSLLANAYFDLFDGAQELWNVGVLSHRPTRGSVYVGLRQVRGGGLDSQILTASTSYAMSPKWIATAATAYDLGENRNRGQSLTLTRVGLDFLVHVGATFDESKGNAGIAVSVEPRIGPFDASSNQVRSLLQPR